MANAITVKIRVSHEAEATPVILTYKIKSKAILTRCQIIHKVVFLKENLGSQRQ